MKALEIEGWMKPAELHWLASQAVHRRRIIEVGSWKGRSTRALAEGGASVIAVDTWGGTPAAPATQAEYYDEVIKHGADYIFGQFQENVAGLNVEPWRMPSHVAATALMISYGPAFDMVFIDGDHAYDAVCDDIFAYRQLLRPGGLLCGHDYHSGCSGVIAAVDQLLPDRIIGPESIWSVEL